MTPNCIIKRLPDNVINQIKAGEVVERPLNVIKELVENSIDAGSSRVRVELLDGGKRLIQVSDNGSGIPKSQAFLAVERHTTSKLTAFEDLETLQSFGFRGEALASIASVSRFSIKTKTEIDAIGLEACFEDGKSISEQNVVMNTGTTITVKDIFHNVPARLKFLRSTATEFSLIQEFLTAMALSRPEISFQFLNNGRSVFDYKSAQSFDERFSEVMGVDAKNYTRVNFERGQFQISGFTLLPDKIKPSHNTLLTFVNNRFVKDRLIRAGVYNGYQGLLMKGMSPGSLLFIRVDPKMLDVNAHPSKTEVRFYDPIMVQDFISRGIESAIKTTLNENFRQPEPQFYAKQRGFAVSHNNDTGSLQKYESLRSFEPTNDIPLASRSTASFPSVVSSRGLTAGFRTENVAPAVKPRDDMDDTKLHNENPTVLFSQSSHSNPFSNAKFLNQYALCYLIFENNSELWFVDQHAFHERILFEKIQRQYNENKISRQMLLNPTLISTHHLFSELYAEHSQLFQSLGFEIEVLKNNTLAVHSFPTFLNSKYLETIFSEITQKLYAQENVNLSSLYHDCFATMACHSAIRAGEPLSGEFVSQLMNRAGDVDFFAHCPHGRPVFRKFSENDVARWFERL